MTKTEKIRIYVIVGPTASGKTAAAIGVAKLMNEHYGRPVAEIISADSIQIYREMDIGSAKPTLDEMQGIPHHMLDIADIGDGGYNVALFRKNAGCCIHDIVKRGGIPIIVGGTGLYVNSLVFPLNFSEAEPDFERREELTRQECESPGMLHKMLSEIDPDTARRLHPNDTKRIVRAIEVYEQTGKTLSSVGGDFINERGAEIEFEPIIAGLNMDRKMLYERIEKRVDLMLEAGFLDEVKRIMVKGYDRSLPALQGLGYKQLIMHLNGECTLDEAIELIKRDTRRFAKRQISWFKRDERIKWFDTQEYMDGVELSNAIFKDFMASREML